jgi:hypothetical protein
MPSGKKAYPKIEDNQDGTVTIRYQPTETGLHELHLLDVCFYRLIPTMGQTVWFIEDSVLFRVHFKQLHCICICLVFFQIVFLGRKLI